MVCAFYCCQKKFTNVITDQKLNGMLAQHFHPSCSTEDRATVFASFQNLAEQTKSWLVTNQLSRAKRCFETVNAIYNDCNCVARMAIENVFMFSVLHFIDTLPNRKEAHTILPDGLRELASLQRNAHDI